MGKLLKYRSYILSAALTTISLLLMVYALKIYPFGDKTFLWADADQYFAFEHYFGSTTGKNDIFYSWCNVLGGNALSQLAYYSFSPYNVVYMVFINHMILAAHIVAYLKIISAALTFCYCLEYIHRDDDFIMKSVLSLCYSFMGYMIFYGWNSSWMDGVILLPVMYVGILKIIEKKNAFQYTASLGLAIISNFYIGFMLCIGSAVLYMAALLQTKNFWKGLRDTAVHYVLFSLIGAGLSAFILIPTYLGLPDSRKLSVIDVFMDMRVDVQPSVILSGIFTGQINTLDGNAPLIYVGILPLILVVIYFVCHKASIKKKMVYSALIITFMLSFENSFLNKIWHGMSDNSWFNYRYSFLMSFVLLLIAYDSYILIKEEKVSKQEYMKAGLVLFVLAALELNHAVYRSRIIGLHSDIFFICLFAALFVLGYQKKRAFIVLITLQVMYCSILNGCCYLNDYPTESKNKYNEYKSIMTDAMNCIQDDSFYRMDKSFSLGRCDANLFNYNGVSNYASTENLDNLKYVKKLGAMHSWMWGRYTPDMPEASESLLGMKYILTDTLNSKDYINVSSQAGSQVDSQAGSQAGSQVDSQAGSQVDSQAGSQVDSQAGSHENIQFYKNPHALPILFPSVKLAALNADDLNNFELQNAIWKSINGIDKNVFTANTVSAKGVSENSVSENTVSANTVSNTASAGNHAFSISINKSGSAYIEVPGGPYTVTKAEGTDLNKEITYTDFSEIYYVGEFDEGTTFDLIVTTTEDNCDLNSITCYTEDKSVIEENYQAVNAANMTINEISSSHLALKYTGNRKNVSTTIPYDEGWTVYDNGKKLEIAENWGNFLAFKLDDSNEHTIQLKYRPVGYHSGLIISMIAFMLLALYEGYFVVRDKRFRKILEMLPPVHGNRQFFL